MVAADLLIFRLINGAAGYNPALDLFAVAVANGLTWGCAGLLGALWWWPGPHRFQRRVTVVLLVMAVLLALGTTDLFNLVMYRPRPYVAHHVTLLTGGAPSNSFPSQHAAGAAAFMGVLPYSRWWQWLLAWSLAWFLAYARVYMGVHYPSDVLAGLLIGWLTGFAVRYNAPLLQDFAVRMVTNLEELL